MLVVGRPYAESTAHKADVEVNYLKTLDSSSPGCRQVNVERTSAAQPTSRPAPVLGRRPGDPAKVAV